MSCESEAHDWAVMFDDHAALRIPLLQSDYQLLQQQYMKFLLKCKPELDINVQDLLKDSLSTFLEFYEENSKYLED